jgi:lipopolysaccharide biosynthesis glycosyltransferase
MTTDISDKYLANTENAYVCAIFNGDKYVTGALTLAESIIETGSTFDRVCLHTNDVSQDGLEKLRKFFTHVIEVEEINVQTIPMKSEKQNQLYPWINKSFTKWNCLRLTQYKKILFCDCDLIFIKNCDELFDLKPPAATFSNPWVYYYLKNKNKENGNKGIDKSNPYAINGVELKHGVEVNSETALRALDYSFVCYGSMVLLRPSDNHFGLFMRWIIGAQPYGHKGISGFDEQSITEFYITELKVKWRNIHQMYNYCPRKEYWLPNKEEPKVYHYIGSNPWEHPRELWEDTKKWWECYDKVTAKIAKNYA